MLALVQDGELGLDAPAATYLDGVGPIDDTVSVRDLLRHTSGLRDFFALPEFFEGVVEDPERRWALEDLLELVLSVPPESRDWSYSNTNYLVLWLLLERVGGSPVPDQLRKRVTEPLGLEGTHFGDRSERLTQGFMPPDNPFRPAEHELVEANELTASIAYPAALVSTPADVSRFLEALLDGTLLSTAVRGELLASVPAHWDESDEYGLGIARISSFYDTSPSPCGDAWGHAGLSLGHTTIALSREDGTRQVVLVANLGMIGAEAWHPLAEAAWSAFCGDGQR